MPLWAAAAKGKADWAAIYEGFQSAVDWPTAGFFRELNAAYPEARFVLTVRSPESWVDSFSATIYKLLGAGIKPQRPCRTGWRWGSPSLPRPAFPPGSTWTN